MATKCDGLPVKNPSTCDIDWTKPRKFVFKPIGAQIPDILDIADIEKREWLAVELPDGEPEPVNIEFTIPKP